MSIKVSTLLRKVQSLPNDRNRSTIMDFYNYMQQEGSSENHIINNLKVIIDFANYLGHISFDEINQREAAGIFSIVIPLALRNGFVSSPPLNANALSSSPFAYLLAMEIAYFGG